MNKEEKIEFDSHRLCWAKHNVEWDLALLRQLPS
jgi:hypothetical protein